jgi:hypothetical protein
MGTRKACLACFQNIFDPLELLSLVAANTEKIRLERAVIDMFYHNPVILAREFDCIVKHSVLIATQFGFSQIDAISVAIRENSKKSSYKSPFRSSQCIFSSLCQSIDYCLAFYFVATNKSLFSKIF